MKLSQESAKQLEVILQTAATGNIDALIIEDGFVRGVNADKSFAMISNFNVPNLPQKMGLTRVPSLIARLTLFKDIAVDVKETDRGEISQIEISSGKNKVQFRCTSTMLIKAPKAINDDEDCQIRVAKGEIKTLMDAIRVMSAKKLSLTIRKGGVVQFGISDASNDLFTLVLEEPTDKDDTVTHNYNSDVLVSLLKTKSETEMLVLKIGELGTIESEINGHIIKILPQIGDEE